MEAVRIPLPAQEAIPAGDPSVKKTGIDGCEVTLEAERITGL